MTREELIKLIGVTIEDGLEAHDLLHDTAEAILNLKWKCKACGGSGTLPFKDKGESLKCHTCKGTGRGEKMLAVIDPDQSFPMSPYTYEQPIPTDIRNQALKELTTPQGGTVWMKVIE